MTFAALIVKPFPCGPGLDMRQASYFLGPGIGLIANFNLDIPNDKKLRHIITVMNSFSGTYLEFCLNFS